MLYQGVLTAWAWGFSRILDAVIEKVPEFDKERVGAIGCSRDGKSALAAGIFDERVRHFADQWDSMLIDEEFSVHTSDAYVKWTGRHCTLAIPIPRT